MIYYELLMLSSRFDQSHDRILCLHLARARLSAHTTSRPIYLTAQLLPQHATPVVEVCITPQRDDQDGQSRRPDARGLIYLQKIILTKHGVQESEASSIERHQHVVLAAAVQEKFSEA